MRTQVVKRRRRSVSYAKWGYFFIAPFFIVYFAFQLIPLISTFYNSFFENYRVGLMQVGPNFVGFENFVKIITESELPRFALNTVVLWFIGFIPQILVAMLLALIFTNYRMNIRGQGIFKTVIYMPNLIMASAFSMLFFALFSDQGPVNILLMNLGVIEEPFRFLSNVGATRGLIASMNYLMWFGNTTILLMAGIMGIDQALFEAAEVDGASSTQVFFRVTLPLLAPILVFVLITSMIGGIQMFDVPQILTNGNGNPDRTSMTLIMYLNKHLASKNYGLAGVVSVFIFFVTGILSIFVYRSLTKSAREEEKLINNRRKADKKRRMRHGH